MDDNIYEIIKEKNMAKAERYLIDSDVKGRRHKNICKKCYYLRNFDFINIPTKCNCVKCKEKMTFSDSDVNLICINCAKKENLCVKCGGEMD